MRAIFSTAWKRLSLARRVELFSLSPLLFELLPLAKIFRIVFLAVVKLSGTRVKDLTVAVSRVIN